MSGFSKLPRQRMLVRKMTAVWRRHLHKLFQDVRHADGPCYLRGAFPPPFPALQPSRHPLSSAGPMWALHGARRMEIGRVFLGCQSRKRHPPATARLRFRGSCRPRGTERRVWRQGTVCLAHCIRDRGFDPGAKMCKKIQGSGGARVKWGGGSRNNSGLSAEEKATTMSGPRAGLRKFITVGLPQHLAVLWPFQVELLRSDDGGFPGVADVATTCSIEQLR